MLVVNTASMITATGLRTDPLGLASSSHGVRSGGIHMRSIVGTHNGRVLMVGKDDGHIYELDYSVSGNNTKLASRQVKQKAHSSVCMHIAWPG